MKAPNIIYLQTCGSCCNHELCPKECEECKFEDVDEVTWSQDRIFDTDRIYFSEDAVKDAVIDMLNSANIDNFDEAIEYLMNRLKGETK